MSTSKTILGMLFLALLIILALKDWSCNEPAEPSVNIDSIAATHEAILAVKDNRIAVLDSQISEAKHQLRSDSTLIVKANALIKPLNQKVRDLVAANERLKAAGDIPGRLDNCDSLADYSLRFAIQEDSLRALNEAYQQLGSDLGVIYGAAIDAANDKALAETRQRQYLESLLRATPAPVRESPISLGLHAGYGVSAGGMSPVISVGINYRLIKFKRK
ncbi:DUF6808 domain-containing protein [Flavihumibacter petaseus]|uniref:DUF6808 domain-containing protein n=1 Tax=Flavihumibacter petaseus NBRC 106054 TaxID=1220578 RepID=A0A0E9N1S8_9BACT|nr:hypothetical protein [Flavihumibacter petaseus]GAO43809.1 hypothetical protein FPE01S_02_09150 [Flavihumibacter petaseus NBRC 106054]